MEIESLAPESFRNLTPHRCELHPRLNLVVGDNGEGKTNLLEAVALVAGQPSFRTADLRSLPSAGSASATVSVRLRETAPGAGDGEVLAVAVGEGSRRHYVAGARVGQLEARRRLPAVFLTGSDLARFSGPPAGRRRALDRLSFCLEPTHVRDLAGYERARASKARLLSSAARPDPDELAVYDETMAALGGRVAYARGRALRVLAVALRREAERLSSPWAGLDLALAPGFAGASRAGSPAGEEADAGALGKLLLEEIRSRGNEERRARRCLVGPHRDDVRATVDGVPVTERVSSGENRTLVLAWTLAETSVLSEAGGRPPLLAFDDFDSEWDPSVLHAFAGALAEDAQVLLTSARPESLRGLPLPGGWLFRMEKGRPHREGILGGGRSGRSHDTEQQELHSRRAGSEAVTR